MCGAAVFWHDEEQLLFEHDDTLNPYISPKEYTAPLQFGREQESGRAIQKHCSRKCDDVVGQLGKTHIGYAVPLCFFLL